ncbi:MAG TPA: molybdopterin-dependent oxidoreductase [Verrucomicrobiae bacterium]|nr:molybdopterin-dependent oxidoreductase [Verrucomicrobiae bacterium]
MSSENKNEDQEFKKASRRKFLKQGAALACMTAAGLKAAAQGQEDPKLRTDYVPEDQVPQDHVVRNPWTGEMMRDEEGNLVVDWTGTPQWAAYQKSTRAVGGSRYGKIEVDSRLYGVRSKFVTTHRRAFDGGSGPGYSGTPTAPESIKTYFFSLLSPIDAQMGVITPAGLHFTDEHGEVPEIDPREHRLTIYGMVDRPITLTMDELMSLPSVSRVHFVECNSDGETRDLRKLDWATAGHCFGELSCSEWTGVLMSTLLDMVGVKKGAKWFYASAGDEYNQTWSIPLWKGMDDALIAYGQNGEPLRIEQGFPVRLVVPGFQGTMNIKRLRRIKITDELTLFHRMYGDTRANGKITWFRLELPPQSCILRPSGGQQLTRHGFQEIRGIAWSGQGKITRVEVTVDAGKTWKDAQIQGPVHSKAHTRFTFPWTWNGQETIIAARCTDEKGSVQPLTPEAAKMRGYSLENFKKEVIQRNNIPQPWKIDRDGRITNAIFSI